ncbi:MAG: phosphomannomutase [Proteobacteria bacterium]|nr:phosphomannomutase [Pseudomonadota bacterium]MBU1688203.1 phosphomannomutase [Pseudomonadota bacterium]
MSQQKHLACFKAYDIRGRVPDELNADLAFRIGQAYARRFQPKRMAIGYDIRLSSPELATALARGFLTAGVEVVDLGQCGTEEIYFAAFHLEVDGGIIVTASHNPADYNGMKMVRKGAVPISGDSGLRDLEQLTIAGEPCIATTPGRVETFDHRPAYIDHLLGLTDLSALKPLKVVVNSGNGCAGPVLDLLETRLPFTLIKIHHQPDGTFPNGVPNPLLPENREVTARAVRDNGADLGLAWDGDFDRCFFFDEHGEFIEGYFIVGLLAEVMLAKHPGAKIIHDPRLIWNTQEIVTAGGGIPVMSKTGHAFIKERMRAEDAIYGGEMSAHHYFRDFAYCDSGMVPWLMICELLSRKGVPLSHLVADRMKAFPVSGEINSTVTDPDATLAEIEAHYAPLKGDKDLTDGLSLSFDDFRFNVRKSNTEPLLRLNVETRGNQALLEEKTGELLGIIKRM